MADPETTKQKTQQEENESLLDEAAAIISANPPDRKLTNKGDLVFPSDLDSKDNFVNFLISDKYQYNSRSITDPVATITLPMPRELRTAYKSNYNNQEMGPLGNFIAESVSGAGSLGDLPSTLAENASMAGAIAGGANYAVKALESSAAPLISGLIADAGTSKWSKPLAGFGAAGATIGVGALIKGALGGAGVARNPHLAVLFDGPDFRSHTFSYILAPKNEKEQETLKDLILAFKEAMLPSYILENHFFAYPRQFDIQIPLGAKKNGSNPYMFDIATSVLTDFQVNYHANGPYYHKIGEYKAPVAVEISMQFTEITVTTRKEVAPRASGGEGR